MHDPEGLKRLIAGFGYLLLFAIIFAETGLLVGFFLPGNSLLFIAGFVAANAEKFGVNLSIGPMILLLCIASIVGDSVGYSIGRKAGPALFSRPDSRFLNANISITRTLFMKSMGQKPSFWRASSPSFALSRPLSRARRAWITSNFCPITIFLKPSLGS